MAGNCIYPAVSGRPWNLFIGLFVFFWRRIMSLVCQIMRSFGRVGEGGEERDLDRQVPDKIPVESEGKGQCLEKPFHVQKMTVKFEDSVTEFYHDCNELISHVHEFFDSGDGSGEPKYDLGGNPFSERVHTVSDTEEPGKILQNHIQCFDEDPDGHTLVQTVSDTEESGKVRRNHIQCSDEVRDGHALVQDENDTNGDGDGDAVKSKPDTQGQEEEMFRIPNEEEHHLRFSDEEVINTTGHSDFLVQDVEFDTKMETIPRMDGCEAVSENPILEIAQKDEPNESEHGEVQPNGNIKDENSEDLGDGNASVFYEYDEDYEDDDHEFFIQKLKSDIKRLKGPNLSVIPEESESDLFDSSIWDSETEESTGESPMDERSPEFRTLEPEEEESIEVFYEKYTERMRYFDMLNYQQIYTMGLVQISHETLKSSKPEGVAKRLRKSLTSKSQASDESEELTMRLQKGLETVYVGQTCLSWEALHWQYKMFQQMVLSGPEHDLFYDYVADQFQQFQVLLQRFLENEEFEGPRVLNYVKNRCVLRSFLHVPPLKGSTKAEALAETETSMVTAAQLVNMMEECILLFSDFVKADKIKSTMPSQLLLNFLCGHQELEDPNDSGLLRAVRKQLHSKELQVRELQRRGRCIIKRLDSRTGEGLEILMALVDIRLVSRVLKMSRISTDHLQWCQKKLNKLSVSD
ncbi:hypothetical protein KI387_039334, partial [Taxus chinensis]